MDFPRDLLARFLADEVVAFVGSGPSIDAGLPSWSDLLREIAHDVGRGRETAAALAEGRFLDLAQYLAREIGERSVQTKVAEILRRGERPGRIHTLIVGVPFRGIVTTNYDTLLTLADRDRRFALPVNHRTSPLTQHLKSRFVFHFHGHVDDPSSIVLTQQGYDRFGVGEEAPAMSFLKGVFRQFTALFIGFGFRDSNVDEIFREMRNEEIVTGWNVFALVAVPDPSLPDPVLHSALRYRGIRPIYLERAADHGVGALCNWLSALQRTLDRIERARAHPAAASLPGTVTTELEQVLSDGVHQRSLGEALSQLQDRPDLAGATWSTSGNGETLLQAVTTQELRQLLKTVNAAEPHPSLVEALSLLPPDE